MSDIIKSTNVKAIRKDVKLPGDSPPDPNPDIVERLEGLLVKARSGELRQFSFCTVTSAELDWDFLGDFASDIYSMHSIMIHNLNTYYDSMYKPTLALLRGEEGEQ